MQLRGKALRSTRQLGTGQKNGSQGGGGVQIDWGDGGGKQDSQCQASPQGSGESPRERLAEASAEVITALRAAKEELAKELEANLKQLKSVLKETERIQREMEAVLKETQCSPSLHEKAKGDGGHEKPKGQEGNEKREAKGRERPQAGQQRQDDPKPNQDAQGQQGQDQGHQGQDQGQQGQDQGQQGNGQGGQGGQGGGQGSANQGGQQSPWQARSDQQGPANQTSCQPQAGQGGYQNQGNNQGQVGQASDGRRFRRRPITPWSQIGTGRGAGPTPSWNPQVGPKGAPQQWQPPDRYYQQGGPGN